MTPRFVAAVRLRRISSIGHAGASGYIAALWPLLELLGSESEP